MFNINYLTQYDYIVKLIYYLSNLRDVERNIILSKSKLSLFINPLVLTTRYKYFK